MKPSDSLRTEKEVLRAKLKLLEALLPMGRISQYPILDLTSSIARRLQSHTEKEAVLLSVVEDLQSEPAAAVTSGLSEEHASQRRTFDALHYLLMHTAPASLGAIAAQASGFIHRLQEHLEQEERVVFPMLDRLLTPQLAQEATQRISRELDEIDDREGAPSGPLRSLPYPITDDLTVNHVVHLHPFGREILEAFGVDVELDGERYLEEISWLRAVDVPRLVTTLNDAAPQLPL